MVNIIHDCRLTNYDLALYNQNIGLVEIFILENRKSEIVNTESIWL